MQRTSSRPRQRDSTQLVRQWALLRLLARARRGLSVKELADQLHTSKSTIERDLSTIEQHFALLEEADGQQRRRYRLERDCLPAGAVRFSEAELRALEAVDSLAQATLGSAPHAALRSVIDKIRGLMVTTRGETRSRHDSEDSNMDSGRTSTITHPQPELHPRR